MKPNSAAARDIAYHLHPATNARRHEQIGPMVIERGHGIYVVDDQGQEYIEGLAGLWSVAVGFGEERLARVADAQLRKLPYYHSFAHKSHPAVIDLSERLVGISPERLTKVFFTNSGSEANDTAIKLIWYANNARGRPEKKKIISRHRAYHGITIAAASLTGLPPNHRLFDLPLPGFLHVSCPHHYRGAEPGESQEDFATRLAEELDETIVREGPDTVAAFIGEPLMGAGGVIVPPRTYWEKIQAVLRKHDVWLIADEVINGFGRTGRMFACETYGIDPDVMVLSKQITSSYAPLAAVLISDEIYEAVADGSAEVGTFGHGFTGSGHPVATAVGLENLNIIEERDLVGHAAAMSAPFLDALHGFADRPLVGETRGAGLIGAVELVADKATKAAFAQPGATGQAVAEACHREGLIIRAIGDVIAFCPPLIIEAGEIADMFARFDRALSQVEATQAAA
ncbi:aspartate aminotransferase family protein [Microbaculum marinisediminis]|uniref:Aspartate aminotransferase family protein n=1 Tax=Microbaculum marinisediminis TaxID=2931392 RepID=A0AAW5R7K6_9HYPH|nr:aspartate aminotransferase family protein [Microbaculum sp. A6E488]MCT8974653.1 aspartate aminotransferase family protein [Microbaculum sp. A6E488]